MSTMREHISYLDHNQDNDLYLGKSLVLCILMTDGEVKITQLP